MGPFEVVVHESRSEPNDIPLAQILIHSFGAVSESRSGAVKFAVVLQVMQTDFESIASQELAQFLGNLVIPFGDKIEGRSESQPHVQFHELLTPIESCPGFNVMSEDKSKTLSEWPTWPTLGRLTGFLI